MEDDPVQEERWKNPLVARLDPDASDQKPHHFLPVLNESENPDEFVEFEQVAQLWKLQNPQNSLGRPEIPEEPVDWERRKGINQEPGFQVVLHDAFGLKDDSFFVVESREEEVEDDVQNEQEIHHQVDDRPLSRLRIPKRQTVRRHSHCEDNREGNDVLPDFVKNFIGENDEPTNFVFYVGEFSHLDPEFLLKGKEEETG